MCDGHTLQGSFLKVVEVEGCALEGLLVGCALEGCHVGSSEGSLVDGLRVDGCSVGGLRVDGCSVGCMDGLRVDGCSVGGLRVGSTGSWMDVDGA